MIKSDDLNIKDYIEPIYDEHGITFIVLVAVNNDSYLNSPKKIGCNFGCPIGGYVYNSLIDCYISYCSDFLPIGYIKGNYSLTMQGAGDWKVQVPMSDTMLIQRMSDWQLTALEQFRKDYNFDCKINKLICII